MVVIEKNEGLGVTSEESPVVGLILGARTKSRPALEEAVPGVVVNDFSVADGSIGDAYRRDRNLEYERYIRQRRKR